MTFNKNGFETFFSTEKMTDMMKTFQQTPFDFDRMLDMQRKNIETMSKVNEMTFDCLQKIAKKNAEVTASIMSEQSKAFQETMSAPTPEQGLRKQTELSQKSYETSVSEVQKAGEMIAKLNDDITSVMSKHMTSTMNDMKDVVTPATTAKGKKAA
jgi:phasin family protein